MICRRRLIQDISGIVLTKHTPHIPDLAQEGLNSYWQKMYNLKYDALLLRAAQVPNLDMTNFHTKFAIDRHTSR